MSKLIIKTQPTATNISLENFSTDIQNILEPYVTPYLSCKNKKERDDIIYKASVQAQMREEEVKSVLGWEKRRIMEVHANSSNEAFLDQYKIREQIPKDKLPCFADIDMFGKVQYSKRVSGVPLITTNLQYFFKVSEEYVCSGLRA
jgi:hypothetical protein